MSKHPVIIDLSSDSSSDSSYSSLSGWNAYFPHAASSSSRRPRKIIFKLPSPSPSPPPCPPASLQFYEDVEHSDEDDETFAVSKRKVPMERPERLPRPPMQVLGLSSPRWLALQGQGRAAPRSKPRCQGKGKKPME
jgi:hypothetical protein